MVRDNSRLPFEVKRDVKQERQPEESGKKRVEVFASPEKAVMVLSALKKMNPEATFYDSEG